MATLEKITSVLAALELSHGQTIPLADLRQAMAHACEELAAAAPASRVSAPASSSEQCSAMTKPTSKNAEPKQCSKKGTNVGTDNKHYCTTHFKTAYPELAAAAAAAAPPKPERKPRAPKGEKAEKKAAPKATVGKGSLNPTCDHDITGKNARKCAAAGKQEINGKWYCTTHAKKHTAAGAAAAKDAVAGNKIAKAMQFSQPTVDEQLGCAIDENGLCYVGDYEGNGVSVLGRLQGGVITPELSATDEAFCQDNGMPVIPLEERVRIIALPLAERMLMTVADEEPGESAVAAE